LAAPKASPHLPTARSATSSPCTLPATANSLLIDPAEVGAHLLAAAPTRHWLEYVDWACAILAEPMRIENDNAVISGRPGTRVAWNEDAVKRYLMK
jgi:L-alanine-DL-glutamate epimerase-like enolase superfamily enzyme